MNRDVVSAIREELWDAGFRPVPIVNIDTRCDSPGKKPFGTEWQLKARLNPPEAVGSIEATALNTGILCDGLRAIDIDIEDAAAVARIRAMAIFTFGETIMRVRDNSARCLLVYRAAKGEPPKRVLKGALGKVEVLGLGQQFVAYGLHPTGAELRWIDKGPHETLRTSIPGVTEEQIDKFFQDVGPVVGEAKETASSTPHETQAEVIDLINQLKAADAEAIDGVADLAGPLSEKLTAAIKASGRLQARWAGDTADLTKAGKDNSRSGRDMSLASMLKGLSFEDAEAAQVLLAYEHGGAHDAIKHPTAWLRLRYAARTVLRAGYANMDDERPKAEASSGSGNETKPDTKLLPLIYFGQAEANLNTADFVEGLLTEGAMSVVYGPSNCGKTFFATDLGLHVACGWKWRDKEVEVGGVIYGALEGSHGISNRVAAFKAKHGIVDGVPFAIVPVSINLLDPNADRQKLVDTIKAAELQMGTPAKLVVIDTLSRALAGGNENAPDDMGALVNSADFIRQHTKAHLMFIHHSGKDQAAGARGHSLLRAATDTEIEISRENKDAPSVARVTKQREMEIDGTFVFTLETVVLGKNRRGKDVTSCVVQSQEGDAPAKRMRLPEGARAALTALSESLAKYGEKVTIRDIPENVPVVPVDTWRREFYARSTLDSQEARKKAFQRATKDLIAAGAAVVLHDRAWIVERDK